MATPAWHISGQYYETCSCDSVCPCILTQMGGAPSKGACTFAMTFQVERGSFGSVPLDGVSFIVLGRTPGAMAKGDWSVGVVADEKASAEQRDAIAAITSGAAGGPMSVMTGLVARFLGIASAPIRVDRNGASWSVTAGELVDMAAQGIMGLNPEQREPIHLDNTGHPASDRVALARAIRSHVEALGLAWHDDSGRNNGQYAPFAWRSA
jgi:hypothetical protein